MDRGGFLLGVLIQPGTPFFGHRLKNYYPLADMGG